jgi:hypothetical protein
MNGHSFRSRVLQNGKARLRTAPMKALNQSLFVRYGGDTNFQPSVSATKIFSVKDLV